MPHLQSEKVSCCCTRWIYNNLRYEWVDEIVLKWSGKSWELMIEKRISKPLGMPLPISGYDVSLDNVAKSYMALENGTSYHLARPYPRDGKTWKKHWLYRATYTMRRITAQLLCLQRTTRKSM